MEKRGSNYYTLVVPYATTSLEGVFDLNAVVYTDEQNKNVPAHTSIMLPDTDTADDISNIFFS